MFKYKSVKDQIRTVEKENVRLNRESQQNRADLDFVAAMCDVEIPEETAENPDMEVVENE